MEIAALIISLLALAFTFYTHFRFDGKIKEQQRLLNEQQLEKNAKEDEDGKKAVITASVVDQENNRQSSAFVDRTIQIRNNGKAEARNLAVTFPDQNSGIRITSYPSSINILPQNSITITCQIYRGATYYLDLNFQWEDDYSADNEVSQTVRI